MLWHQNASVLSLTSQSNGVGNIRSFVYKTTAKENVNKWKRTETAGELVYGTTGIMIKYSYHDSLSCGLYSVLWGNNGNYISDNRFFGLVEAKLHGERFYKEMKEIGMLS